MFQKSGVSFGLSFLKKSISVVNHIHSISNKREPRLCHSSMKDAEQSLILFRYVNGTRLDDRLIRVDWDAGFIEGRQYGRGKSGGQVRDEYRTDYDAGRGGYGKLLQQKIAPNTDTR